MEKSLQSSTPISYCRKVNTKLQKIKAEPHGLNILLKSVHGKSIMVFIPDLSPITHDKSAIDSSITATFKTLIDSKTKLPVNSSIDLTFNKSSESTTNSPVHVTVKVPEAKRESSAKSLIRHEAAAKQSSSEEESFYEVFNQQLTSSLDESIQDLPVLPNESYNTTPIYNMYNEKLSSSSKEPESYEMFIITDDKNIEVDCQKTKELIMILLTELLNWDVNPDFMKFKKHISDPVFNILKQYDDNNDDENDYDDIPELKVEPKLQLAIANDNVKISTKRKRKPKVYSDDYYCEDIIQANNKKIKLDNSPLLKRKTTSFQNKIMKKEIILKPKKMMTQKYEQEMTSISDEISLLPNGTKISAKQFDTIKWNSASTATRKLLRMIFSNEILATHSLTGRPSPAFIGIDRPLKQQLNPKIIQDIISTVLSNTDGSERIIRAAITTKCADTAKLVRNAKLIKTSNLNKTQ